MGGIYNVLCTRWFVVSWIRSMNSMFLDTVSYKVDSSYMVFVPELVIELMCRFWWRVSEAD